MSGTKAGAAKRHPDAWRAAQAVAALARWERNFAERFWARVARADGDACWLWTGGQHGSGYGLIRRRRRALGAHRVAWELHHGQPVPDGLNVLHSCDTPLCCRPSHLFVGTALDNQQDMTAKGRGRVGPRSGRWIDGRSYARYGRPEDRG